MNEMDELFPKIQKSINDLIEDEEGNIPASRLLVLGTLMVILGNLFAVDAFAAHRSHSSHKSHSSHVSSSTGSTYYTHSNHSSHESHQSHTSHSNSASHSNSLYSAEGDVSYSAPAANSIPAISVQPVQTTSDTFTLPDVNENIELPNGTPASGILPAMAVPASSVSSKIDAGNLHMPSLTDKVK